MINTKCIFVGGKPIGVLCLLQLLRHKIRPAMVIGNPDDNGKDINWNKSIVKIAKSKGLKVERGRRLTHPLLVEKIQKINPEIIFCIGGTRIIPQDILKIPRLGCINIHPALLPKYRGRYSTVHAIFNGDSYTGVTLHRMDSGIDSGPVILQERIAIDRDDTARSLYEKFTLIGEKLFIKFLNMWLRGDAIPSRPQNIRKATYNPKCLPNNGEIDWSWDGEKIRNFIRAMTFEPFPPPSFRLGRKRMVIVEEKYFRGFK